MKVFISADIEGVTTTSEWMDTTVGSVTYPIHAKQMSLEVLAACEGAIEAGATDILVKDAHDSGANIDLTILPECVRVHRKWSGHPYSMVDTIDNTYDALMFVGYHSAASKADNPLSHTMNTKLVYIKMNDAIISEFTLHSYAGAYEKVPTVFLSGDSGLCEYSQSMDPAHPSLITVAVKDGQGAATINNSPSLMVKAIKENSANALRQNLKNALIKLPNKFKVEICYKEHTTAYKMSFYPGVKLLNDNTVVFENDNYFEVLRTLKFIL